MTISEVRTLLTSAASTARQRAGNAIRTARPKVEPTFTSLKEGAAQIKDTVSGRLAQSERYTSAKNAAKTTAQNWFNKPQVQAGITQVKDWFTTALSTAKSFIGKSKQAAAENT